MRAKPDLETKASKPDEVNAHMCKLKHPLADVVEALRQVILDADGDIGEEIKWNAPSFFYTGPLRPFSGSRLTARFRFPVKLPYHHPAHLPERGGAKSARAIQQRVMSYEIQERCPKE